ncbi:threonine-phosphate decarboxylase [Desulfohalotomaculum tongense]|uniref:threonine-phosphate decarboxylase CobD n=1 Tax=Desulforadius tongensis TaxID=1216062 RepID=UPI001EE5F3ED|nr:threonine-phosphate decarboxylase CobD [Desulforadius tongensis]MBM7854332.1 threonine-phosphate decarboxylase [Desulforadius tongensis]
MCTENMHGGNIWAAARRYNRKPENFIDFSANINPLGPSPLALEAMRKGISLVQHYPDPDARDLKIKLSRYLEVPGENLLLGNGGAEIIYALGRALNPRRLVLPVPTFSEYRQALPRVPVKFIPLPAGSDFALPVDQIKRIMQPGDAVFICNPNNPTGYLVSRGELLPLAQRAFETGAALVVDEAFMDFTGRKETILPDVLSCCSAAVVGSLTKFFALPGLRLGYLTAEKTLVEKVSRQLPPWRVNTLAQLAAQASLEDRSYISKTLKLISKEKEFLYQGLAGVPGLHPYPPRANFILVNCSGTGKTAKEIRDRLAEKNILIRVADNFIGLDHCYFRVAVRREKENRLLLKALNEIV